MLLIGETFEEVDHFTHSGLEVAVDGGREREVVREMNEGYKACGVQKMCAER